MAGQTRNKVAYGLSEALPVMPPQPIIALRAPTTTDFAPLATIWVQPKTSAGVAVNSSWILTSIINNLATWQLMEAAGGTGLFSSLTVTPGPISLTGTTNINTSGTGVTTIGTGGTGAVNIGNATGNTAVTGTLTSTAGITASTGNIVATLGNITASAATSRITGGTLYASGDALGVAGTTSLTNVVNNTQGAGALTLLSANANSGTNTGFLKIYVGSVICFVPYFNTITP